MITQCSCACIVLALLSVGVEFLRGGFHSSKYGLTFDFAEYNPHIGSVLPLIALFVFLLGVLGGRKRDADPIAGKHP